MNDGKWWERKVARALRRLQCAGLLRAVRVRDPWARIGRAYRPVANPWGDFAGCLIGGRMFVVECKSTADDRFRLGATLTNAQMAALAQWERWGASVWVLWCVAREWYYAARPIELARAHARARRLTLRTDAFRCVGGGRALNLWAAFAQDVEWDRPGVADGPAKNLFTPGSDAL